MPSRQDRLIHWLLDSLDLQTTLFHLGQYCGSWKASTTGLARAGFHVVLNGECWLHLPESGNKVALKAGDAVFFLRDLPHVLSPHEDSVQATQAPRCTMDNIDFAIPGSTALACGFFEFRSQLNRLFLDSFPEYIVLHRDDASLPEIHPIFDLLVAEAQAGSEEPSPLISRLVDLLFFYVVRHLSRRQDVSTGLWAVLSRPEFTPLLEAVLGDPGRDWSIEAMADLTHMSRATFFKRFTQAAGTSPSHFVTLVRMKLAAQLIEEGLSLSRAAEQVGYQSDAAFSRAFKKTTGTLPGAFRRAATSSLRLAA